MFVPAICKVFGKLSTYFQHKRSFNFEKYLNLKSKDDRVILAKFRISNHCLRVETGRYERKNNSHGKNVKTFVNTVPQVQQKMNYIFYSNVHCTTILGESF